MSSRVGDTLLHFGPNERLVSSFTQAEVRFVVIGGLAVAWHCLERTADDMDLLLDPTEENSERVAACLRGLQLTGFSAETFSRRGLQVPLKQHLYAELLTPAHDGPSFSDTEANAVDGKLFGIPVRIASVSTLIQMKERASASGASAKEKHLADIKLLMRNAP